MMSKAVAGGLGGFVVFLAVGVLVAQGTKQDGPNVARQTRKGPVVDYDFSKNTGALLRDATGTVPDARVRGAKFVKVGDGYALKFDGKDDYVDCGTPDVLDPAWDLTLEVWMRPDGVPKEGEPGVLGKPPWRFGLTYYKTENVYWYISGGDNHLKAPFPADRWHHVVATFDTKTMKLYVDGALAASRDTKREVIRQGKNFYVGRSPDLGTYGGFFKGMIGEVRVYEHALSAADVIGNYRASRGRFAE